MTEYLLQEDETAVVMENDKIKEILTNQGFEIEGFSRDFSSKKKFPSRITILTNQTRNVRGYLHRVFKQFAM